MRPAALFVTAFLAFPPAVVAQFAVAPSSAPIAVPASPAAAARHYLWEVSGLTNRVYLYGTVHSGKASFYPLAEPVRKAFAVSGALAVEADITDAEAMRKSSSVMLLKPPDILSNHVPAPLYARFRKQLERLDLPEAQVAPLKPFFAASFISFAEWGQQGYLPQYGVDLQLINLAREEKKRIVEVEGTQLQTALMGSLTEKEGLQALEGAVSALESGMTREQITGLVNAWQSGEPKLLLDVVSEYNERTPGAAELEEKFIWSRHEAMAQKIEAFILNGRERVFVAVGALHLAGPRGLVEILRARGYTVKQL